MPAAMIAMETQITMYHDTMLHHVNIFTRPVRLLEKLQVYIDSLLHQIFLQFNLSSLRLTCFKQSSKSLASKRGNQQLKRAAIEG